MVGNLIGKLGSPIDKKIGCSSGIFQLTLFRTFLVVSVDCTLQVESFVRWLRYVHVEGYGGATSGMEAGKSEASLGNFQVSFSIVDEYSMSHIA